MYFLFSNFAQRFGRGFKLFYFKDNKLIIIQIDISGHNISTSIISVILKGYLEQNVQSINIDFSNKNVTKDIVAIVHDFVKKQLKNHYLSVIVLCVDFDLNEVVISKCGHPVPILIISDSQHILLESTGSIIHPEFFIESEVSITH